MKQTLSNEQKQIVYYNEGDGALLVEASAGSGKTRVLTERVRYLLTQKSGRFSVLCLTFTNKAAEEMKERLSDIHKINERSFIGTIHAFGLDILYSKRHELGFEEMPHIFEREEDRKKVVQKVLLENPILKKSFNRPDLKQKQNLLNNWLVFISKVKRNLIVLDDDRFDYNGWNFQQQSLYKLYNQLLRAQNAIDYDDILLYAFRLLIERPAIAQLYRRIYNYILIDEAQDLNYAQYHMIKALCGNTQTNVMMVGDPNQAIYGFNGSDKKFMQVDFVKDLHAERKIISKNYRSSKHVMAFAQKIRSDIAIEDSFFSGEAKVYEFNDETKEAEWIIEKVKNILSQKVYRENEIEEEISLEDIVILARNRFVFSKLAEKLQQDETFKDNFFYKKNTSGYESESDIMKIFDLGTRVIANPFDVLHFSQILNKLKLDLPHTTNNAEELLNLDNQTDYPAIKILTQAWNILNRNQSHFVRAINYIKNEIDYLDDNEKALVIFDISEWEKLWKSYLRNSNPDSISLSNFRRFLALGHQQCHRKKQCLMLGTIHTVKGLEFHTVFLMGMTQGTFPDYRAIRGKSLIEERNNAYVAVTRAKRQIYITYPKKKLMPWGDIKIQDTSSFLKDFSIECINN